MSYATIAKHVCEICGSEHESNDILIHKRLKNIPKDLIFGTSNCAKCKEILSKGYVALIGIDPKNSVEHEGKIKQKDAYRTGKLAFIKREKINDVFNTHIEAKYDSVFVEDEVIDILEKSTISSNIH